MILICHRCRSILLLLRLVLWLYASIGACVWLVGSLVASLIVALPANILLLLIVLLIVIVVILPLGILLLLWVIIVLLIIIILLWQNRSRLLSRLAYWLTLDLETRPTLVLGRFLLRRSRWSWRLKAALRCSFAGSCLVLLLFGDEYSTAT